MWLKTYSGENYNSTETCVHWKGIVPELFQCLPNKNIAMSKRSWSTCCSTSVSYQRCYQDNWQQLLTTDSNCCTLFSTA